MSCKFYLIQFLDDWMDFRYAEFLALIRLEGYDPASLRAIPTHDTRPTSPAKDDTSTTFTIASLLAHLREREVLQHFLIFEFPDEAALVRIANRAVLIKSVYEYWAHEANFEQTVQAVRSLDPSFVNPYLRSSSSWSVQVIGFCKSYTMPEKQALRTHFSFLDFSGPVDIKHPEHEFWVLLDYSSDPKADKESGTLPTLPCYFARRLLAVHGMKETLRKYSLKTRLYLGPTSLDDSLSFILANMVGVKSGMLAYEPFVGTGSIVVALAHLGVFCVGSDIDPRVLRGDMYAGKDTSAATSSSSNPATPQRDVSANFKHYALPLPELVRMDAHLFERHFLPSAVRAEDRGYFDIIVTDPPYGIRAGARKSGRKEGSRGTDYNILAARRDDHVPSTQTYAVEEVMLDLLENAAKCLVVGGQLVYLIPTTYDFTVDDLPKHPCLALREVCHQPLSSRHGRRAVVMEKIAPYLDAPDAASANTNGSVRNRAEGIERIFAAYKQRVLSGEDGGFGQLTRKLEAALANDAFQNDSVVKQLSICSQKRRESKERRIKMRVERKESGNSVARAGSKGAKTSEAIPTAVENGHIDQPAPSDMDVDTA